MLTAHKVQSRLAPNVRLIGRAAKWAAGYAAPVTTAGSARRLLAVRFRARGRLFRFSNPTSAVDHAIENTGGNDQIDIVKVKNHARINGAALYPVHEIRHREGTPFKYPDNKRESSRRYF